MYHQVMPRSGISIAIVITLAISPCILFRRVGTTMYMYHITRARVIILNIMDQDSVEMTMTITTENIQNEKMKTVVIIKNEINMTKEIMKEKVKTGVIGKTNEANVREFVVDCFSE
jgi:hypothetical protein